MTDQRPTSAPRERILDASRELFARLGYHGSSLRDIAAELNVSVSSVYNHFRSKDAILVEILRRPIVECMGEVREEMARSEGEPPLERLRRCLRKHYAYLLTHKQDAELINSEYLRLTDSERATIIEFRNEYEELFRGLIIDCLPANQRDPRPPQVSVAVNILLGITGNAHRWFREDGSLDRDEVVDFYLAIALGGVAAALQLEG